jgi:hypothetical protein
MTIIGNGTLPSFLRNPVPEGIGDILGKEGFVE